MPFCQNHINSEEHGLLVHFLEKADLNWTYIVDFSVLPLLLRFWEMTVLFCLWTTSTIIEFCSITQYYDYKCTGNNDQNYLADSKFRKVRHIFKNIWFWKQTNQMSVHRCRENWCNNQHEVLSVGRDKTAICLFLDKKLQVWIWID